MGELSLEDWVRFLSCQWGTPLLGGFEEGSVDQVSPGDGWRSGQVSRGSDAEYQADERAEVARLRWRVSGR